MATIRAFVESDIPAVAAMHQRAFPNGSQAIVADHLREVFLENPWRDAELPSLVYDGPGGVTGFLGVVPRRMSCGGAPMRVATSSQFMVDGENRGKAAVELLKRFMAGPQDLSLADEASETSRRVWVALGGDVSLLQGLRWTRILRPCRFAASLAGQTRAGRALQRLSGPLSALGDALATRAPGSPFRPRRPAARADDLTPGTLLALMSAAAGRIRPVYDEPSLEWLLGMLERKRCFGRLRKRAVRGDDHNLLGGYLYYVRPTRTAEVAYLTATPGGFDAVWNDLVFDAWHHGAMAVSGRLDPRLLDQLSDARCIFNRGFGSVLFHTRNREIQDALHRGTLRISRLDGEWWMRFIGEPAEPPPPSTPQPRLA